MSLPLVTLLSSCCHPAVTLLSTCPHAPQKNQPAPTHTPTDTVFCRMGHFPKISGWKSCVLMQHPSEFLIQSPQPCQLSASSEDSGECLVAFLCHFVMSPSQGCLEQVGAGVGCTERSQHVGPGPAVPTQELDLRVFTW